MVDKFDDNLFEDVEYTDPKNMDDSLFEDTEFSAQEPVEYEEPKDISQTESAIKGTLDEAAFGFMDELKGGAEAAGSLLGLRGVGGEFKDIRKETPEEKAQSLLDVYRQGRDAARQEYKDVEEANPKTYMGGQIAGAILSPGSKAKGIVGGMIAAAKYGAGSALGRSEADLTEGDVAGAAEDIAEGAASSAAFSGALGAVGKGLKGVGKFAAKKALKIDDDVLEKALDNPQALRAVRESSELQEDLIKMRNSLSEDGFALSKAAKDKLTDDIITTKTDVLTKLNEGLAETAEPRFKEANKAIKELVEYVQSKGDDITQKDLKNIQQNIADAAYSKDKAFGTIGKDSLAYVKGIERQIDDMLSSANPEYRQLLNQAGKKIRTTNKIDKAFNLKKDTIELEDGFERVISPSASTETKLKRAATKDIGPEKGTLEDLKKALKDEPSEQLVKDIEAYGLNEQLDKVQGLRQDLRLGTVGLLGGTMGPAAAAAGAGLVYSPDIARTTIKNIDRLKRLARPFQGERPSQVIGRETVDVQQNLMDMLNEFRSLKDNPGAQDIANDIEKLDSEDQEEANRSEYKLMQQPAFRKSLNREKKEE